MALVIRLPLPTHCDEVLEENPWVAVSVFDAFFEARDRAIEWNKRPSYNMTITWAHLYLIEQRERLSEDAWEYGLTSRVRPELQTFIRYAADQGLVPEEYEPEEPFEDSTLDV